MTVEPLQPNPYTQARETLAAALAGLPWPVHLVAPATVTPPCLVIYPSRSGWIAAKGYVGLLVTIIAVRTGPQDNSLLRIEDMAHRTRTALRAAGLHPAESGGPQVPEGRITVEIPVTVRAAAL